MSLLAAVLHVPASLEAAEVRVALVDYGKWHERSQAAAAISARRLGMRRAERVMPVRQLSGAVLTRTLGSVQRNKMRRAHRRLRR